jgi:hypothetical protein
MRRDANAAGARSKADGGPGDGEAWCVRVIVLDARGT